MTRSKFFVLSAVLLLLLSWFVRSKKAFVYYGETMGTTFSVQAYIPLWTSKDDLKQIIQLRLDAINASMSTYDTQSEISQFNVFDRTDLFEISDDFYAVLDVAKSLYDITDGAWDGTVGPLVELWGFGREKHQSLPSQRDISRVATHVGFDQIILDSPGCISKLDPALYLDLSSIAKGYGVDALVDLLKEIGSKQAFVEIGGEVRVLGLRVDGRPWRVGVQLPEYDADWSMLYGVVSLEDSAMATSGDYRQYFVVDDVAYSHVIDPRTGWPVRYEIASVSVVAPTCVFADGLATALMVTGVERGLEIVGRLEGVEAMYLLRVGDGQFKKVATEGFVVTEVGD